MLMFCWCGLAAEAFAQPAPTSADAVSTEDINDLLDQALLDIRTAEKRGPDAQEAFARARQRVDIVRQRDPRNLRAGFYQGRLEVLGNQSSLAIHRIREWVNSRQGSNDWEGHFILGKVYFDTAFYKLTKPVLEKAIDLNPREASIYALLSRCETKLANSVAAVQRAQQAVQMLGANADADSYILLTEALVLGEQLNDADRAARAARDLALTRLRTEGAGVETLSKANECIQLLMNISQSRVAVDPTSAGLYLDISRLIQEQAEVATLLAVHNAVQWTLRGLQQSADRPPEALIVESGKLLLRIGRTVDAEKILRRGREIHPESSKIKELYESLAPPAGEDDEPPPAAGVHTP